MRADPDRTCRARGSGLTWLRGRGRGRARARAMARARGNGEGRGRGQDRGSLIWLTPH